MGNSGIELSNLTQMTKITAFENLGGLEDPPDLLVRLIPVVPWHSRYFAG